MNDLIATSSGSPSKQNPDKPEVGSTMTLVVGMWGNNRPYREGDFIQPSEFLVEVKSVKRLKVEYEEA